MTKLKDLAKIIRSKNSGPYEITFDIMFQKKEVYEHVKQSGVLTRELIQKLYCVSDQDIITCMFFDPAQAFKFTLKRQEGSLQGSVNESDTFGAQQHAPLFDIEIPD